jgi:hypothetical protein
VDKSEKAMELLERAAQLGLRVEFRSGLNILQKTAPLDPEVIASMMEQLAKYLPEIREIALRRAVSALGKTLVSRRIWSEGHGEGTLVGADEDGNLSISIGAEMRRSHEDEVRRSQRSITSKAESLLILDETTSNSTSLSNDPAVPEQAKRGIFELFRRSPGKD